MKRCMILVILLMSSFMQAETEQVVQCEKELAEKAVKSEGKAQVIAADAAQVPAKKEKKKKREQAPQATPVTSTIFAKKTLSTMNFDELKKSKQEFVKSGDKQSAIKYLERMVPICNDLEELKAIMLELAQLLYEAEDYTKASKMYHEFTLLYPGSDEVEYAMYQAITSSFKLTLDAEHDQSKTVETRELIQAFLDRASFTTYKKEVQELAVKCDERLLESDINIFNFYMKRGNYLAASARLSTIKKAYAGKTIPGIELRIANLERVYASETTIVPVDQKTVIALQEKKEDKEDSGKQSFVDRF